MRGATVSNVQLENSPPRRSFQEEIRQPESFSLGKVRGVLKTSLASRSSVVQAVYLTRQSSLLGLFQTKTHSSRTSWRVVLQIKSAVRIERQIPRKFLIAPSGLMAQSKLCDQKLLSGLVEFRKDSPDHIVKVGPFSCRIPPGSCDPEGSPAGVSYKWSRD